MWFCRQHNLVYVEYVNGKSKINNSVTSLSQWMCLLWLFFVAINHLIWHLRTDLRLLMGSFWHPSMAVKWCLTEIRLRRTDCSKKWKTKTCNASKYQFTDAQRDAKSCSATYFTEVKVMQAEQNVSCSSFCCWNSTLCAAVTDIGRIWKSHWLHLIFILMNAAS